MCRHTAALTRPPNSSEHPLSIPAAHGKEIPLTYWHRTQTNLRGLADFVRAANPGLPGALHGGLSRGASGTKAERSGQQRTSKRRNNVMHRYDPFAVGVLSFLVNAHRVNKLGAIGHNRRAVHKILMTQRLPAPPVPATAARGKDRSFLGNTAGLWTPTPTGGAAPAAPTLTRGTAKDRRQDEPQGGAAAPPRSHGPQRGGEQRGQLGSPGRGEGEEEGGHYQSSALPRGKPAPPAAAQPPRAAMARPANAGAVLGTPGRPGPGVGRAGGRASAAPTPERAGRPRCEQMAAGCCRGGIQPGRGGVSAAPVPAVRDAGGAAGRTGHADVRNAGAVARIVRVGNDIQPNQRLPAQLEKSHVQKAEVSKLLYQGSLKPEMRVFPPPCVKRKKNNNL